MKDGTQDLMKFKLLTTDLGLDPCYVGGILQFIWNFSKANCPRGDIGRFSNADIAVGIGYTGDPDKLMAALVKRKWVDECQCGMRLIIHDWAEHAEDSVHRKLARRKQWFADGTAPNVARIDKKEKTAVTKFYNTNTCGDSAQRVHAVRTPCTPTRAITEPSPATPTPEPLPEPAVPASARSSGARLDISPEVLRTLPLLRVWFDQESTRADGWVKGSDAEWLNVQAAAAKAVSTPGLEDVAFFKWVVKWANWEYLTCKHEQIAKAMAREQTAKPPPLAVVLKPVPNDAPPPNNADIIRRRSAAEGIYR